jgi:hypothetical protein
MRWCRWRGKERGRWIGTASLPYGSTSRGSSRGPYPAGIGFTPKIYCISRLPFDTAQVAAGGKW